MPIRTSLVLCAVLAATVTACGDDTQAAGGGRPDDGDGTGETTGATTTGEVSSTADASAASSSSTGEPEVCPWFGADPGTLVATGAAIGDVIENVGGLVDQCGVVRSLWDFAGGYRILSMTPGW